MVARAKGEFFSPPQSSRWNKPGKQKAFLSIKARLCVTSVMSFCLLDLFFYPVIEEWLFRQRSQCAFKNTTSNAQIIKKKKAPVLFVRDLTSPHHSSLLVC